MGFPMGVIRASGILWIPKLNNYVADSFQIKFIGTGWACTCAASWLFAHRAQMGMTRMQELNNTWADSLQIKFIGTILACRCTTLWSFAHWGHMGMPMGIISSLGTCPNSANTRRINSRLSSLEPFCLWMCSFMVICPSGQHGHAHGRNNGSWNIADTKTQQPLGRFTPNRVHCNHIGLYMYNAMVICPSEPLGHAYGCNKCPWNLVHRAEDPTVICLLFWNLCYDDRE